MILTCLRAQRSERKCDNSTSEFLGKLAIVEVMPTAAAASRDFSHPRQFLAITRPEQYSLRAAARGDADSIPGRASVSVPDGQQRANGQQAFLLEVVIADETDVLRSCRSMISANLVALRSAGLGNSLDGASAESSGPVKAASTCRVSTIMKNLLLAECGAPCRRRN